MDLYQAIAMISVNEAGRDRLGRRVHVRNRLARTPAR
jgi:hypothetical protein